MTECECSSSLDLQREDKKTELHWETMDKPKVCFCRAYMVGGVSLYLVMQASVWPMMQCHLTQLFRGASFRMQGGSFKISGSS